MTKFFTATKDGEEVLLKRVGESLFQQFGTENLISRHYEPILQLTEVRIVPITAQVVEEGAWDDLINAIRLTQEYSQLPAVEGWSWYDALKKHAPDVLAQLNPPRMEEPKEVGTSLPPLSLESLKSSFDSYMSAYGWRLSKLEQAVFNPTRVEGK